MWPPIGLREVSFFELIRSVENQVSPHEVKRKKDAGHLMLSSVIGCMSPSSVGEKPLKEAQ